MMTPNTKDTVPRASTRKRPSGTGLSRYFSKLSWYQMIQRIPDKTCQGLLFFSWGDTKQY